MHARTLRLAVYTLIVLIGVIHILYLPGGSNAFTPDSHEYRAGAESILREGRYLDSKGQPQQVWSPATSLLYAGLMRATGADIVALVKWVDLAAYLLLGIACIAIAEITHMRLAIGAAMLAAILCNGVLLSLHNKILSDPGAFVALAWLLVMLTLAAKHPERATRYLLSAVIFAAIAILFRYAMLPVVALVMVVAVMLRRWVLALLAPLAIAPLPLTLALLGASPGQRTTTLIAPPWSDDLAGALRLADQVFPAKLGWVALLAFVLCCLALPLVLERRNAAAHWAAGYSAFLPIAQITAVPSFPFDVRILMPIYIGGMIATAAACESAAQRKSRWTIPLAIALALAAMRSLRFALTQIG